MTNYKIINILFNEFDENNKRMVTVFDYAKQKKVVIEDLNLCLKNKLKMDIGNGLFFNNSFYGWVYGVIVQITSDPDCGDKYMIRYYLEEEDDEDEMYLDEVIGNEIEYHR